MILLRTVLILDGFPRTIIQARELESIAKEFGFDIDAVINIDVPSEKLIKRLSGRITCKDCGTTYHVVFNPPKTEAYATSVVENSISVLMRAKKLYRLDLILMKSRLDHLLTIIQ